MMKNCKGNCKEGTSKEKKTCGDYDRIDRFYVQQQFSLEPKLITITRKRNSSRV